MTISDYKKFGKDKVGPYKHRFALMYLIYSIIIGITSNISYIYRYSFSDDIVTNSGSGSTTMTFEELMSYLKANLNAILPILIGLTVISLIIGTIYEIFVIGPMTYSWTDICYKTGLANCSPEFNDLFTGLKSGKEQYFKIVKATLFMLIDELVWSIFTFGIMGIVQSYAYSQVYYILRDNPNITLKEALKLSKKIMKGNKGELFCLDLSYIGWTLLSLLTFGILMYWIEPQILMAKFAFYKDKTFVYSVNEGSKQVL